MRKIGAAFLLSAVVAFANLGCGGSDLDLVGVTRLRAQNAINVGETVDFYYYPERPGSPITVDALSPSAAALDFNEFSPFFEVEGGDYRFVFTRAGTKEILAEAVRRVEGREDLTVRLEQGRPSGTLPFYFVRFVTNRPR